ncbi:unnamed protein product [Ilex paraguariensis]|uniref:Reverse transcriptase zinc-binding domain-containing protein n=1 Tax=Ilex paraguariensis TaxID=185542 RepID=A0ABC8ULA3_9AQUA
MGVLHLVCILFTYIYLKSIKRGYHAAGKAKQKKVFEVKSSSNKPHPKLWNLIWNLKTAPKIRHFWWKVCSDAFAILENLFKRKCVESPVCQICESKVETIDQDYLNSGLFEYMVQIQVSYTTVS